MALVSIVAGCDEPRSGGRTVAEWERAIASDEAMGQELLAAGDEGGPVWIALSESSRQLSVRRQASRALCELWRWTESRPAESGAALAKLASDADDEVRTAASVAMVRLIRGTSERNEILEKLLGTRGPDATALRELAHAAAIPAWLRQRVVALAAEPGAPAALAIVLVSHGAESGQPVERVRIFLEDATASRDDRILALGSLGRNPRAALAVHAAIARVLSRSRDREERLMCGQALGALSQSSGVDVASSCKPIAEDDVGVKLVLRYATDRIAGRAVDPASLAAARESAHLPVHVMAAQIELAADPSATAAAEVVRQCLRSDVAGRRREAIAGLTRLRAFPPVFGGDIEKLEREDRDWRVVQEARRYLAAAGRSR